ncbi:winged helix-turn-helix domain-containing protein [Pantoea sp. BRR-3P]|uniref:winged helix-turn-helix domain-containing protein n=1 Tax=Pantoea sp. BRR-3P TaxID=3141541 RepID=UPI0031F4D264
MSVYIIESKVAFNTDMPSLAGLGSAQPNIPISAAAARCLVALIESAGEPVSREQLIYAGWGAMGHIVSENSLNQAVTQLRKVLKELELNGELIMTVPRLGYKISRMFSIECAGVTTSTDLSETSAMVEEDETHDMAKSSRQERYRAAPSRQPTSRLMGRMRLALLSTIVVLASFSLFWVVNKSTVQQIFTQYHTVHYLPLVTRFNQLQVFYNQSIDTQNDYLANALKQLESDEWFHRILEGEVHFIYINGSYNPDVFSYFLCREEIQQHAKGCEAYTSIQEGT